MALSRNAPQERNAQSELMHALSALHLGGKYSDLTITCNYKQWSVHRAIVCSQSGFFDGACSHQFREASSGTIDLSEDDEEAVEQMIHFLYHLDYLNQEPEQQPSAMFRHRAYSDARNKVAKKIDLAQIQDPLLAQAGFYDQRQQSTSPPGSSHGRRSRSSTLEFAKMAQGKARAGTPPLTVDESSEEESEEEDDSTESESHLVLHAQVYALAEKYDIPSLKQLSKRKFEMAAACYYDAPELAEAIEYVYTSTIDHDRGLRDVVCQLFRNHPYLASTADIYQTIKETPTLALDLWKLERGLHAQRVTRRS